jgi:hypothetical protein
MDHVLCGRGLTALRLVALLMSCGLAPALAFGATSVTFDTSVRLPTFQSCGGYEPGIAIDGFGNIFVTAHKQNHCDAVALDPSAPDGVRAASWLWISSDGVNFSDLPGLTPVALDQVDFGDEGDVALDDAMHLYFVDTKVKEDSMTRWTAAGPGKSNVQFEYTLPILPSFQAVDDRPWVTAHGDNIVMFADNEGDKVTYPLGTAGRGCGPGRYTIYMSTNAATTFDPQGCTLPDSGWCRPAADHTPGSQYLYMFCDNDAGTNGVTGANPGDPGFTVGTLWSYVSADNGYTWKRYKVDTYNSDLPSGSNTNGDITWPSLTVAARGDLYALWADPVTGHDPSLVTPTNSDDRYKRATHLKLYHSTDNGKTWAMQDVTPPNSGIIRYSWMGIADDGKTVGVGYFTHPTLTGNWHVFAGASPRFGSPVTYALVDPVEIAPAGDFAFGDFFEVAFDRAGRLNVVYTRCVDLVPGDSTTDCLNSEVYFARTTASLTRD